MMEASRLAESRRALYGVDAIANSVRAIGGSPSDPSWPLPALLLVPGEASAAACHAYMNTHHASLPAACMLHCMLA